MADTTLLSGASAPDLRVSRGDLVIDDGLVSAVLISLFSDSRFGGERGWWADDDEPGWGSELWRYERDSPATINLAQLKAADEKALAWLVADGVMRSVSVDVSIDAEGTLVHRVALTDRLGRLLVVDVVDNFGGEQGPAVVAPPASSWLITELGEPITAGGVPIEV